METIPAIRILSYRTRARAVMWFWDPMVLLYMGPVFAVLLFGLPWGIALALGALLLCWFSQVSVARDGSGSLRLSRSFLVIPFRWRRGSVASLRTTRDDDFSIGPDDAIAVDEWELQCYRPERVADWIRDAATGFSLPPASIVEPKGQVAATERPPP